MDELSRIKDAYKRREASGKIKIYTPFSKSNLFGRQQRERDLIDLMKSHSISELEHKKILDIGCGNGHILREMVKYGADPANCYGIDIMEDRIEKARYLSPNMTFTCSSADNLRFDNNTFDLVIIFTTFSSILDSQLRKAIADEAMRVLKPTGCILYYDYHMNNPKNPDVQGVKKREIIRLFGELCDIRRITLVPPLARLLAPFSWTLCLLLENLKFLNSHYLSVIRKNEK